jgi:hypothetical protein
MTQVEVRREAHLTEIRLAEQKLVRDVTKSVAIAVPVCMLIWLGMVALALAIADWGGSWTAALCIGLVVGAFAGAFFGGWAGALKASHALDAADDHRD